MENEQTRGERELDAMSGRIKQRLAVLTKSARGASIEAGLPADAINNILNKRAHPTAVRVAQIAQALQTTPSWLMGWSDRVGDEGHDAHANSATPSFVVEATPTTVAIPLRQDMSRSIPVYGSALGAEMALETDQAKQIAVELTDLNTGDIIDFFRRPAALERNRKVYGLYVAGSSMEPAFESGSAIVVEPTRPPAIRDYVIVYLRRPTGTGDEEVSSVLVKRLVRRSASYVELEQYNPAGTFRIDIKDVAAMHRVLTITDLLGM